MTVAQETSTITVQMGSARPGLPDPYRQGAGARMQIDYKQQGKVVKSERFARVTFDHDGETMARWRRLYS